MKVTSELAYTVDYAREFGGELGLRLHRAYRIKVDGVTIMPLIKWEYSKPDNYMIDTYKQNENGYIFINCKSRKECHQWIKNNVRMFVELETV